MATKLVRVKTILDMLKDPGTVTNAEALRVANAFLSTYHREIDPATLNNEQKVGMILPHIRAYVKGIVRDAEIQVAVETAHRQAAPAAEIELGADGGT